MSLNKIEKDLYNSKSDIEKREHGKSTFNIDENVNADEKDKKFGEEKKDWDNSKNSGIDENRKRVMTIGGIVLGIILFISVSTVVVVKIKQSAFSQSKVLVSVEGNTEAKSGQETSYIIKYENNNRVALKDVEIILNHSENFYPNEIGRLIRNSDRNSKIIIGDLKAKTKGDIKVTGKFYAAENYTVYLQPVLTYRPSNSSSEFRTESQLGVKITTSPITLEINAPKEALDESTAEYKIVYRNTGTIPFDSLNLRLEYSDGFIFQGADPYPVEGNNTWHIGKLNSGEEKTITMQGKIEGNQFDVKSIKATLFRNESGQREVVFGKVEELTKVVVPPLAISHKINNQNFLNINLGDTLNCEVSYANNGSIALRDIIVKLKIDSPVVNYADLSLDVGAYNNDTKTITWKASDIAQLKNLEPGKSGVIRFYIPIKEKINIDSNFDENFVMESIVSIDSSDEAFHSLGASKNISNKVISKLNSKVILEQQAFFNDVVIENSGSIPPKVGEETSYAIHWKIANVSNDISDVKVNAYLPTWVKWKGKVFPDGKNIEFNKRTHEIVWNVGDLENGTGILNEPREIVFQISILPEVNQIKKDIPIITKTILTAKDNFTLNNIKEEVSTKTTLIREDEEMIPAGYYVIE